MSAAYKLPQYRVRLVRERTRAYAAPTCGSASDAARVAHALLDDSDRERMIVIGLSGTNAPLGVEVAAVGGLHGVGIRTADLLKSVILMNASSFIVAHNHPSGDKTPSEQDLVFTRALHAAARAIGIPLVDHIIVAGAAHYSFFDQGVMP
jgi:DNA repair protein RadC